MALSDDQRALLRLLAQREEGYEDIAALMGVSVTEVRARVKGALEELQSGAGEPPAAPPEAALGEAAAISEPPSSPRPPQSPQPSASPPEPTAEPPSPPPPARPKPSAHRRSLPGNRRLAELVGGALLVLVLILFATGAVDIGGDDADSNGDSGVAALGDRIPTSGEKEATQAILKGVGGSDASGRALFGRAKKQVVLVVAAEGLEPSPLGRSYAISLGRSPNERVPIAASKVGKEGTISAQYQVAANVLGLIASGYDQMEVSLVVNKELRASLTEAQRAGKVPSFGGDDVLRGQITGPIVNVNDEGDG